MKHLIIIFATICTMLGLGYLTGCTRRFWLLRLPFKILGWWFGFVTSTWLFYFAGRVFGYTHRQRRVFYGNNYYKNK